MKRIVKFLSIMLLTVITFALAGCNTTSSLLKPAFEKTEDIYAFSAFSGSLLLDQEIDSHITVVSHQNNDNKNKTLLLSVATLEETDDSLLVEDQLDGLNKYLNMIEMILGKDNGLGVTQTTSDLIEYQHKLLFSTKNLLGEEIVYEIYYNEIVENEDEDDDEYDALIEGIIRINGIEYLLQGEKEYEEGELKVSMTSILDDDNYVKVEYEVEEGESSFTIEVVINGVTVQEMELEIEIEDDEIKIELSYIYDNIEGSYEFKLEYKDGFQLIKIEYELKDEFGNEEEGEIKIKIIVDPLTNETTYEYQIETETKSSRYTKERRDKVNDDDDDDNDDDDNDDNDDDDNDDDDDDDEVEDDQGDDQEE